MAISKATPVGMILETTPTADLGLELYRNALTRDYVTRFYNSVTYSDVITLAVLAAADKYSIPPGLAFALCGVESRFDITAVSFNSISIDRGLFQLNSLSFPELSEEDFYSLETNADHGLKYLRYCLDRGENEIVALAMYNAGEAQVSSAGTPMTTLQYVSKILTLRDELEKRFRDAILERISF